MNTQRKLLVLSVALAGALSALVTGCDNLQAAPVTPPTATSVGTKIDDTVVTTRVKSALLHDPGVKSFDFKVETRKGVVQLSGFVDNQDQVDRAIATTRAVEGVGSVENNITLKEGKATVGSVVDDSVITSQVKAALLTDPNVKSLDIAVVTRKGDVQLSGYVNTASQITMAISIAQQVEGVKHVTNEMSVKK